MKEYTIKVTRHTNFGTARETIWTGTVTELVDIFKYTLEVGHSYDRKINTNPKTIRSLLTAVQKASDVKYGSTYTCEVYELVK